MSSQLLAVQEQALLLTLEDRVALVDRLLQSLRQEEIPKVDSAWIVEVDRRYSEYKEGRVTGIPADQVFDEIAQEFGR